MLGSWKKMYFLMVDLVGGAGKIIPVLFSLLRTNREETHSFRITAQIQMQWVKCWILELAN